MTPARWTVVATTEPLVVNNAYGAFSMAVHVVTGPGGRRSTEVSLVVNPLEDPCLIRLQSACVNAEAFGDERCPCKRELDAALARIARADSGVVVYSPEADGRGAGLFDKVQAMAVRERLRIADSEARDLLGITRDGRDHEAACAVLRHLGVRRAELLSGSAAKERALASAGIGVVRRIEVEA